MKHRRMTRNETLWQEALLTLWSQDVERNRCVKRRQFFLDWAAWLYWNGVEW